MLQATLTAADQGLTLRQSPMPQPAVDEAVIAIRAAALNHRDLWITKGLYPGISYPCVPGSDACGEVVALGSEVDPALLGQRVIINPGFDWGDRATAQSGDFTILGLPRAGTHASHIVVPEEQLVPAPLHLGDHQAAALPLAGLTAYRALVTQGDCHADHTVLINGIGGGVALMALQFALGLGARVLVTSSEPGKIERAIELGAADGYHYRDENWAKELLADHGGFDIAIDGAGGPGLNQLIKAAKPGARIVIYGGTAGLPEALDIRQLFWKQLRIQGSTMGSPEEFTAMCRFVTEHRIEPVVDQRFPLSDIQAAYDRMDAGRQFGKIILQP